MKILFPKAPLRSALRKVEESVVIEPEKTYKQVTVRLFHRGVVLRGQQAGADIRTTRQWRVRGGQILLSRIDARNGAIGLVPFDLDGAIVTNDFWSFEAGRGVAEPRFLDAYFGTREFVEACKRASEGTTNRVRLQYERFLHITVPLPPLAEQRRIVAQIEELAAKIEEARTLRGKSVADVEAVQSSSAAEAFQGINQAQRLLIEDIAEVRGGIQKGPHRLPGASPVRYLTVAHVQRNRISLSDPRFFEVSSDELTRWRLEAGDVLIIEGNGSPEQIGRTALFCGEIPNCVHQNHVIRIRPNTAIIDPEFLNSYLNSPVGQDEVQARSRTTSGLRSLSIGRIKQIAVPVPSLAEQRRIVAHLDDLQTRMDQLKGLQARTAAELDALLPSILDKAFKGEL